MVHVLTETNRHVGHADILREELDGAVGDDPGALDDGIDWKAHRARVERAAGGSPVAGRGVRAAVERALIRPRQVALVRGLCQPEGSLRDSLM